MKTKEFKPEQVEALWNKAQESGMPRRKFLILLASGGAAAVLTACAPRILAQAPSATTSPPVSPTPSPTTAPRLVNKPVPEQFFIPIGGGNYEMRFEVMANRGYTMPNGLFFIRNHSSSPFIDAKTWQLSIEGDGVSKPFTINYDDLLKMPATTVTRYVECAGNGRSFYDIFLGRPGQGGQWHLGAYGVAEWTGVRFSEILSRAGISSNAVDVMPTGLDSTSVERPMAVSKAMEDDTILAYMMNGDLLPIDHGFPVRAVVPGWVGSNSVKWVGKITVSTQPIYVEKNTETYVLIGPDYQAQPPAKGQVLTTQVPKSAICLPWPAALAAGSQKIVGYAWSPFGKVAKVDVSLDEGQTFQPATLTGPNIERAGSRWEFTFTPQSGLKSITPKVTDDKGNTQHPRSEQKWNQLGYVFGALVSHPVTVS